MRHKLIELILDTADADGVCLSQTPSAAGNLIINGAYAVTTYEGMPKVLTTVAEFDVARRITITSGGDDSSRVFTVTAIDGLNRLVTEAITGANSSSAESVRYFKKVLSIAVDDATAGTVTVGTLDEAAYVVPLDHYSDTTAHIEANIDGTIQYTIQQTFNNIQGPDARHVSDEKFLWTTIAGFPSSTSDVSSVVSLHATAAQLIVESHSAGAQIRLAIVQPGRQC